MTLFGTIECKEVSEIPETPRKKYGWLPLLTVLGPATAFLVTGAFVVENLFAVPGVRFSPAIFEVLAVDNTNFSIAPPRYVKSQNFEGMDIILDGLIKEEKDLEKIVLPDPDDDAFYQPARDFVARFRSSNRALGVTTRIGVSNTYLSMGIEHFSLQLYDKPEFVFRILSPNHKQDRSLHARCNLPKK